MNNKGGESGWRFLMWALIHFNSSGQALSRNPWLQGGGEEEREASDQC